MTSLTLPTGQPHPYLLYGTAWKKDRTTDLVSLALKTGFQGIDTACQPKHYREDLVGLGIAASSVPRAALYIQTKFTSPSGQDAATCPYPLTAPLEEKVRISIETSLRNLGTEYLDSVLLHSPWETVAVWRVLEGYVRDGKVRHLGISNVSLRGLEELWEKAAVKPSIVQNRFYEDTRWDCEVRRFCREKGMVWQSFWTLSVNPGLLRREEVAGVAERVLGDRNKRAEALYLLVLALGRGWGKGGVSIMDGTTDLKHMKGDLEAVGKLGEVSEEEIQAFRKIIGDV